MIQHLGDHGQESIRQRTALLGANLYTAHAVDAQIAIGLAGVIHRNCTNGTLLGADTALDAAFISRRMEGGGLS